MWSNSIHTSRSIKWKTSVSSEQSFRLSLLSTCLLSMLIWNVFCIVCSNAQLASFCSLIMVSFSIAFKYSSWKDDSLSSDPIVASCRQWTESFNQIFLWACCFVLNDPTIHQRWDTSTCSSIYNHFPSLSQHQIHHSFHISQISWLFPILYNSHWNSWTISFLSSPTSFALSWST